MAYSKTIWTNGETAVGATNMNKIENELEALDTGKQDNLTAGTNITIDQNNVISATGIDETLVLYNDTTGTNGNINFNYAIENGNEIEIIYNAFHYTKSSGKIPFSNGMGITLDMQYKADVSAHGCINKLIIVNENGITVNNEQTQIIWNIQGYTPNITDTNYIYITKVIVYK